MPKHYGGMKKMMEGGMSKKKMMYGGMMKPKKKKMMYGGMSKKKMMGGGMSNQQMMGGGMPRMKATMGGQMEGKMGTYNSIHDMERDCATKTNVMASSKGYGDKVTIKVTV